MGERKREGRRAAGGGKRYENTTGLRIGRRKTILPLPAFPPRLPSPPLGQVVRPQPSPSVQIILSTPLHLPHLLLLILPPTATATRWTFDLEGTIRLKSEKKNPKKIIETMSPGCLLHLPPPRPPTLVHPSCRPRATWECPSNRVGAALKCHRMLWKPAAATRWATGER